MKQNVRVLPRGRIARWTKEQIASLGTPELRALLANAERLNETEVATLCREILDARPHGHAPARRAAVRGLVSRGKAFALHGVSVRNRVWSRGGVRADGAVLLALRAEDIEHAGGGTTCLLWAPNVADAHPWSDTPAGQERLEHCRMALERGAAEGLLIYGAKADRVDARTLLKLRIEKRDEAYWASWTPQKPIIVREVG